MEATIKTKDAKTFNSVLRFLSDLGIEIIRKDEKVAKQKVKSFQEESFFESAGIWEGRDITKKQLREKSWKKA